MPGNVGGDVLIVIGFPTTNKGAMDKKEFTWEWLTALSCQKDSLATHWKMGSWQMNGGCLPHSQEGGPGP